MIINPADHLGIVRHVAGKMIKRERTGPIEDTEEYSDGVMGLVVAAKRYDPTKAKWSTFAFHYVKGFILTGYDRRKRQQRGEERTIDPMNQDDRLFWLLTKERPQDENIAQRDFVNGLLRHLPKDYRNVLHMRYNLGLTMREVGERLGVTREAIRQKERRAFLYILTKGKF